MSDQHQNRQALAYGENAPQYDDENAGKLRSVQRKAHIAADWITRRCPGNCRILEIGCGTGLFTASLASRLTGATVLATDAFQPMLDLAAKRLARLKNVSLVKQDASEPIQLDSKVDIVCGVDVIHHIEFPEKAMAEWRKVTRPGGHLVFLETNPLNPILFMRLRNRPEEKRLCLNRPANLRNWCRAAGWTNPKVENLPFYLPSGPPFARTLLSAIEDCLHGCRVFKRFSGLLCLQADTGD